MKRLANFLKGKRLLGLLIVLTGALALTGCNNLMKPDTAPVSGGSRSVQISDGAVKLYRETAEEPAAGSTLESALRWLQTMAKAGESYTLELYSDVTWKPIVLDAAAFNKQSGVTLTLKGSGGERVMHLAETGMLLKVKAGVTLVLDADITLKGVADNNTALVGVVDGGKLVMNKGARVTGNTNFSAAGGGGVFVYDAVFEMTGGVIEGEVCIENYGAQKGTPIFTKTGGSIGGNGISRREAGTDNTAVLPDGCAATFYPGTSDNANITIVTSADPYAGEPLFKEDAEISVTLARAGGVSTAEHTYTVTFNGTKGWCYEDNVGFRVWEITRTVTDPATTLGVLPYAPYFRVGTAESSIFMSTHTFTGWNTKKDGTGTPFTGDTKVTEDITVYAQWGERERGHITVIFDKNGGDAEASPNRIEFLYGKDYDLPDPPVRTGYRFMGWNMKRDGSGDSFNPLNKLFKDWMPERENAGLLTLYAQWAPKPRGTTITVTFSKNGGDLNSNPQSKPVFVPGAPVDKLPEPPKWENHEFAGWKDSNGNDFTETTPVTADITVYAQWRIWVSFDPNDGANTPPVRVAVVTPAVSVGPLWPATPLRNGYQVAGWKDGSLKAFDADTPLSGHITVYAHWEAVYVAGSYYNGSNRVACYWQNGTKIDLPAGTGSSEAKAIAVMGWSTLYIVGWYNNGSRDVACYWTNASGTMVKTDLPSEGVLSFATAIVISDDVYIAGTYYPDNTHTVACYWKNGIKQPDLPDPRKSSSADSIAISGNNIVHIAGHRYTGGYDIACYWTNASGEMKQTDLPASTFQSSASTVVVSGGTVYITGWYSQDGHAITACYWKNGTLVPLPGGSNSSASAIALAGRAVFITGYIEDSISHRGCYWTNASGSVITRTELYCGAPNRWAGEANAVFISGSDVYIAGIDCNYMAAYWKNGEFISLPGNGGGTGGIVVLKPY